MIGRFIKLTLIVAGWYLVWPALASSAQSECAVTFGFTGQAQVSGVLVDIDYSGSNGGFLGNADSVECYSAVDGALATFNNIENWQLLKAALVRVDGFGGRELFTCFFAGSEPVVSDFVVDTVDATSPDLVTVVPDSPIGVTAIDCSGASAAGSPTSGGGLTPPSAPLPGNGCELAIIAHSDTPVSGMVVEIDYAGAPAAISGLGDQASCMTAVPGAVAAFNNISDENRLIAALVQVEGFSGDVEVASCYLDALSTPQPSDFRVSVSDAVAPDGSLLAATPIVELAVYCGDGGSVGTDTLAGAVPSSAPGNGSLGRDCGPGYYDVLFALDSDYTVGSLQLSIDYAGAAGEFVGSGEGVDCSLVGEAASGFVAFNDIEALSKISGGFVSIPGVNSGDFVSCTFDAADSAPSLGDFRARVLDATTPTVEPIYPLPAMAVVSIEPAAANGGCASLCGNGRVEAGEACDDGNDSNSDGCLSDCRLASCGDGYVLAGSESCDDGNRSNNDSCLNSCVAASCGDGHVNAGVEDCDAGNANSDVGADACRRDCRLPSCGDGVVDSSESCDDGNQSNSDGCLNDCSAASCGDGYVFVGRESCDDGAANNDADPGSCRRDCSLPEVCGDADGNGVVTATDAKAVLDGAIGLSVNCSQSRCDVDGDARVTATDARLVLTNSVGLGGALECWLPVVISLDDAVSVGALQFDIDYSATGSTFVGDADGVYCATLGDNETFASYNNDSEAGLLHVALVSVDPITGPLPLIACSFYQGDGGFVADDFVVSVLDATDTSARPISLPGLSVAY